MKKTKQPARTASDRPLRAAIYVRVSPKGEDTGKPGLSPEAQERICRQYAETFGWDVDGRIFCDRDISGTVRLQDRPAMKILFRLVEEGQIDVVLVKHLDRLARRARFVHEFVDTLEEKGAAFVAVEQRFDTSTAAGKMFLGILAVFAEFDRNMIAERTRQVLAEKKVRGERLGAPVLGINVETVVSDDGKFTYTRAVEDPNQIKAAEMITDLYEQGRSFRQIAEELKAAGLKTKKGNDEWEATTIRRIALRAKYAN